MADKHQLTLEDLARMEAQALKQREQAKIDRVEGEKKIAVAMPEQFLTMARQVRDAVRRFNSAAPVENPVQYAESAAVTTRETNLNHDFNFSITRKPNEMFVALRNMARGGRPDSFVIDGFGSLGIQPMNDRFTLRVEAHYRNGEIFYRPTCDYKPVDVTMEELPDRLVMVIVTGELTRLWSTPPWVENVRDLTVRR